MKCSECQNEIPAGSVFCPVCGSAQFGEPVEVISRPVAEEKAEAVPATEESKPAPKKKKWWILAVAAGVLAVVVALALVLFTGSQPGYGVYSAGGSVFLTNLSGGEPVMLMEYGSCTDLVMSADQKHLFYRARKAATQIQLLFHLDLQSTSKEPEVLVENAGQFYVSADGTRVTYIRDGNLYVHNLKSQKRIAENVSEFLCDDDVDTFAYTATKLGGRDIVLDRALFFWDGDVETRIVGNARKDVKMLCLSTDGKTLIYSVDDKLYAWKNNESVLIAENTSPESKVFEDGTFYYRVENDAGVRSYCFYDGEKSIDITAAQNVRVISGTEPMLTWQEKNDGPCYLAIRDQVLEIPLENADGITLSEDGRRICITSWGEDGKSDLYCASLSSEGLGQLQLLAQDEWRCLVWFVGERLYYWTGEPLKPGTLYCDGEEILQDVKMEILVHPETGTLLVPGKETSKFEREVFMVRHGEVIQLTDKGKYLRFATNGDALVGLNATGDVAQLWRFDQKGKGTLLAKDVTGIYVIGEPRQPSSKIYWVDGPISSFW